MSMNDLPNKGLQELECACVHMYVCICVCVREERKKDLQTSLLPHCLPLVSLYYLLMRLHYWRIYVYWQKILIPKILPVS